ncbi:hypothetical protein BpHYR1_050560 [Brachionus plicatilis]|uniref:Uncharacterized protein n=1 Tax=Brachionus plicatilis TaxID=10195 RepID=A0A3M7PBQ4_BRAPC|nr:hypothetical protein BpHYR1_050560 [Brachionus plicatilis]
MAGKMNFLKYEFRKSSFTDSFRDESRFKLNGTYVFQSNVERRRCQHVERTQNKILCKLSELSTKLTFFLLFLFRNRLADEDYKNYVLKVKCCAIGAVKTNILLAQSFDAICLLVDFCHIYAIEALFAFRQEFKE